MNKTQWALAAMGGVLAAAHVPAQAQSAPGQSA